jgi:hypothetical protein
MDPPAAPGKAPKPTPKETTNVLDPVTDSVIDPVADVKPEQATRPDRPNFDQPNLRQVNPIEEPDPAPAPAPVPLPKRPTPAPSPVSAKDTFEDSDLNDQERDLLRQLQEELAKREQAEAASSNKKLSWQTDKSGRHADAEAKWSSPAPPRVINGAPPTAGGSIEPPRFPPTA